MSRLQSSQTFFAIVSAPLPNNNYEDDDGNERRYERDQGKRQGRSESHLKPSAEPADRGDALQLDFRLDLSDLLRC